MLYQSGVRLGTSLGLHQWSSTAVALKKSVPSYQYPRVYSSGFLLDAFSLRSLARSLAGPDAAGRVRRLRVAHCATPASTRWKPCCDAQLLRRGQLAHPEPRAARRARSRPPPPPVVGSGVRRATNRVSTRAGAWQANPNKGRGSSLDRIMAIRCEGGCDTFVSLQSELPPMDSPLPFPVGQESYASDANSIADDAARFVRFPIEDLRPASSIEWLAENVDELAARVLRGEVLYIHCFAGVSAVGCVKAGLYRPALALLPPPPLNALTVPAFDSRTATARPHRARGLLPARRALRKPDGRRGVTARRCLLCDPRAVWRCIISRGGRHVSRDGAAAGAGP